MVPTLLLARCEIRACFLERGAVVWPGAALGSRSCPELRPNTMKVRKQGNIALSQSTVTPGSPRPPMPVLGLLIQLTVAQRVMSLWGKCQVCMGSGVRVGSPEHPGQSYCRLCGSTAPPTQAGPWFCKFHFRLRLLQTHPLSFRYKA